MDDARLLELRTIELEPRARGHAAGSALGEQIEIVVRSSRRMFAATRELGIDAVLRLGEAALTRVEAWQPQIVSELEGVADGAGVAPELIGALNARTEIIRAGGCSLMARLDGAEGPWLAQNWDWYVDAPERCVVWTAEVAGGERFVTMTEAGILGKVGMNSRGLAVGLNVLQHVRDGGPMGIPVHVILRALLESCATLEDAQTLIEDAPTSASSAITIVDAAGGGAVFEVSPAGVARIDPRDGRLAHTNHFVDPGLGDGEDADSEREGSRERLELLEAMHPDSLEEAQELLRDHSGTLESVCRHDSPSSTPGLPPVGTVVSLSSEPALGRFQIAAGPPCTFAYQAYELAPLQESLR
ncbi:MAG TPA: C45 family peptidase [Gaiellales bacterium]